MLHCLYFTHNTYNPNHIKYIDAFKPPAGNWTYGKLDNSFGWFPIDYVQPVVEDQVFIAFNFLAFHILHYLVRL